MWRIALSVANKRRWPSLIYVQVLLSVFVCVCGGGWRGGGAVGVSCPVSNSVEPELAASMT